MKLFIQLFLVVFFILGFAGNSFGQINNGCFELMDPCELIVDPCVYINRPTMWDCNNYVAVQSNFIPGIPPHPGSGGEASWQWVFPDNNVVPYEGEYFVILSTGDIRPDTTYSMMTQDVNFVKGQTVEFYYFFGTMDYVPFDDFATVKLHEIDSNGLILHSQEVLNVSIRDITNYNCTPGWVKLNYFLDPNDPNNYNRIEFYVQDVGDAVYNSYFAIDGLKLGFKPELGDLNDDWMVDFQDFAILGQHWNQDSNDPNLLGWADFDDTNSVDVNDLMIFSSYWLDGEPNICPH